MLGITEHFFLFFFVVVTVKSLKLKILVALSRFNFFLTKKIVTDLGPSVKDSLC